MLSNTYKMRPQMHLPVFHEEIAMQCARNIVRVASAMPQPQPRCPNGDIAVLVELRRADEPTIYRYQVNVPSNGWPVNNSQEAVESSQQMVLPGTLEALGFKLPQPKRPPCPMHGRTISEIANATENWSPSSHSGPAPLLMTQTSMHTVNGLSNQIGITSFCEPVLATEVPDSLRAHFMASLYQQHPSPLAYSDIWVQEEPPRRPSRERSSFRPQLCLGENNEYMSNKEKRPINGLKVTPKPSAHDSRRVAELCLDSNGDYVPNELLQRQRLNTTQNGMRREQQYNVEQQGQSLVNRLNGYQTDVSGYAYNRKEISKPKNGYNDQPVAYSDQRNILRQVQGHGPNQTHGRVAMIEPRVRQEAPIESQSKPNLPSLPDVPMASTYPKELQALFRWNYCALCHTVMRTERNAVDHYSSRAHERRISTWLVRQNANGYNVQKANATSDLAGALQCLRSVGPLDFYCDLCDLKLTSLMHAQQHFFGRRHSMVARQMMKPNGEGYYDRDGKWVRTNAKFMMCDLCEVSITSETQMAMHMAGARHRRRFHTVYSSGSIEGMTLSADMGMGRASIDGRHMYRVDANGSLAPLKPLGLQFFQAPQPCPIPEPTAAFYCEACNITMNHLKSLKEHEQGRLHRRNVKKSQSYFYE
ncbi:LOW QUALITY PROTEIN: zinc finger protein 346 [Drosophila eugracilis]|uniref:LOW QUALITY PROTEIN: zinc finger protein 346 n=1 Tax=Drosophila eugracilis TaxID=29029 RepID=UPI001BDAF857|nr:LOW QUALITY PROTEIN: zinc finger protein 346 [Drosophila eugracilis]